MKIKTNVKVGGKQLNHYETLIQDNTNQVTGNDPWLGNEIQRANNIPQDLKWEETLASILFGSLHPPLHPPLHPSVDYRQPI